MMNADGVSAVAAAPPPHTKLNACPAGARAAAQVAAHERRAREAAGLGLDLGGQRARTCVVALHPLKVEPASVTLAAE
jgi:hypothetical protein